MRGCLFPAWLTAGHCLGAFRTRFLVSVSSDTVSFSNLKCLHQKSCPPTGCVNAPLLCHLALLGNAVVPLGKQTFKMSVFFVSSAESREDVTFIISQMYVFLKVSFVLPVVLEVAMPTGDTTIEPCSKPTPPKPVAAPPAASVGAADNPPPKEEGKKKKPDKKGR